MSELEECFKLGLLRRDKPDIEKARRSLVIAERKLDRAKRALVAKLPEEALLNAYAVIFHAARALLFRDGIIERAHWGLYVWIKHKYADRLERKFITELNTLRLERHDIMYELEPPDITATDAEDAIAVAEEFIPAVRRLLAQQVASSERTS